MSLLIMSQEKCNNEFLRVIHQRNKRLENRHLQLFVLVVLLVMVEDKKEKAALVSQSVGDQCKDLRMPVLCHSA
jgi:hypothetical protein